MKITQRQIQWFRLRRNGLVEPFASPVETARTLIGVQGQLLAAADVSFFNRTSGCTIEGLHSARQKKRSLIRLWGQRSTVHVYDTNDWPLLHTVLADRQADIEKKLKKWGNLADFKRLIARTRKKLESGKELSHEDVKSAKLEKQERWVVSYITFMSLVRDGIACYGPERGSESIFVHREHWVPKLKWSPPDPEAGHRELARRYLFAYGPATVGDLAFWHGTTQTKARPWLDSLGKEVCEIEVEGRKLWALSNDLEELSAKPPPPSRWPVRLLYRFDPYVLGLKDKSWIVDAEHYKKVWRPSAHVEPVILVKGRIAGTWKYKKKSKTIDFEFRPFERCSKKTAREVEGQASRIAKFLGKTTGSSEWS